MTESRNFDHIKFTREVNVNPMRRRGGGGDNPSPADSKRQGEILLDQVKKLRQDKIKEAQGYDNRFLVKIEINKSINLDKLPPGIELVSQEEKQIVLAFATQQAMATFEQRFTTLSKGGIPERKDIIYALRSIDSWGVEDRKSSLLKREGFPSEESFFLDIELWPVSKDYRKISSAFESWMIQNNIRDLDKIVTDYLIMYRVEVDVEKANLILTYRDVRIVDFPPKYGINRKSFSLPIDISIEPDKYFGSNVGIVILDTGINANHPLLAPAVGDAQSFVPGSDASDRQGHGTNVAGIALYGDVYRCITDKSFVPKFKIFSGKIIDDINDINDSLNLIERITRAVKYFKENYGCKIFNLSVGDSDKVYDGRHLRDLSVSLDTLSREEDVLFIVSTGNYTHIPDDSINKYPDYLLDDSARLLEPATAINVLTVGSIARYNKSMQSERYSSDPRFQSIADVDQPSPFTRCGPSINGIIKPELVAYGGNIPINLGFGKGVLTNDLGEVSLNSNFTNGLFSVTFGTSFSAPYITHLAAHLLDKYPDFSVNLIRSLLIAKAKHTDAALDMFDDKTHLTRLCGYGYVELSNLLGSNDNEIVLYANDVIEDERHHFYEVPIPEEFYDGAKRFREITVALSYNPPVKTTRIDYKSSKILFNLVPAGSIDEISKSYTEQDKDSSIKKIPEFSTNRSLTIDERSKGTVQSSSWVIRSGNNRKNKKLFIVITRQDPLWGKDSANTREAYAVVICIKDQLGHQIQLYSLIRNIIRVRVQPRIRI